MSLQELQMLAIVGCLLVAFFFYLKMTQAIFMEPNASKSFLFFFFVFFFVILGIFLIFELHSADGYLKTFTPVTRPGICL